MRINQAVRMPSGRPARIIEITQRVVLLKYTEKNWGAGDVSFKRDTFEKMYQQGKVVAAGGVQTPSSDSRGNQPAKPAKEMTGQRNCDTSGVGV